MEEPVEVHVHQASHLPSAKISAECFICRKPITSKLQSYELLNCETQTSKTKLVEKIGNIADQLVIVASVYDAVCRKCFVLLNTIDRLEGGLETLKDEVRGQLMAKSRVETEAVFHVPAAPGEASDGKKGPVTRSTKKKAPVKKSLQVTFMPQKDEAVFIDNTSSKEFFMEEVPMLQQQVAQEETVESQKEEEESTNDLAYEDPVADDPDYVPEDEPQPSSSTFQESDEAQGSGKTPSILSRILRGTEKAGKTRGTLVKPETRSVRLKSKRQREKEPDETEERAEPDTPLTKMLKRLCPDDENRMMDKKARREAITMLLEKSRGVKRTRRAPAGEPSDVSSEERAARLSQLKERIMRQRESEKPSVFQCENCGKCFGSSRALYQHSQREKGATYKCKYCSQSFVSQSQWQKHEWGHTGVRGHVCEMCGKLFQSKTGLQNHISWHRGEYKFRCETCGRGFSQKMNYLSHCAIHTGEKSFRCNICHESFRHYGSLWSHRILIHGQVKKKYKCDLCEKEYQLPNHLAAHKKSHLDVKPYQCQLCNKRFTRATSLKLHMSTHTKQYVYNCRMCEFHTNRKYRASMHAESVHGVLPETLKANFGQFVQLHRHSMEEITQGIQVEEEVAATYVIQEEGMPVIQHVIEEHMVEEHIVEGHVVEEHMIEGHVMEGQVVEGHMVEQAVFEPGTVIIDDTDGTKMDLAEQSVIQAVRSLEVVNGSHVLHGIVYTTT